MFLLRGGVPFAEKSRVRLALEKGDCFLYGVLTDAEGVDIPDLEFLYGFLGVVKCCGSGFFVCRFDLFVFGGVCARDKWPEAPG